MAMSASFALEIGATQPDLRASLSSDDALMRLATVDAFIRPAEGAYAAFNFPDELKGDSLLGLPGVAAHRADPAKIGQLLVFGRHF